MLRRFPLAFFLLFAYGISWICLLSVPWIPEDSWSGAIPVLIWISSYGPSFAGLIMAGLLGGKGGLRDLIRRLFQWRLGVRWYAISLFGMAMLTGTAAAIGSTFAEQPLQMYLSRAGVIVPLFLKNVFLSGGLGEELGWRGFALPLFQNRYKDLPASLVLGLFWGLWHLPDFILSQDRTYSSLPWFLLTLMAFSVVYTWIYNGTRGSLLFVTLFHAASNAAAGTFDQVVPQATTGLLPQVVFLCLLGGWAAAIVLIHGPKRFGDSRPDGRAL